MSLLRLIARLDIKGPNVVKGIRMEGLRVMGDPATLARRYAEEGADELLFIDTVASLYERNNLASLIERTVHDVFVPITVGGGVRSLSDFKGLLRCGADKVAINTAAIRTPELVNEIADKAGSQAVVVSVEHKRTAPGKWEAYTDNGRERSGRCAIAWVHEAVARGAGEILATSVDQDGTRDGFDVEFIRALGYLPVPVTVCGGMGSVQHAKDALASGADAIACASVLHYGKLTIKEMRDALHDFSGNPHQLFTEAQGELAHGHAQG